MRNAIRPFAGSLAEAQGVLAVERATFHESPYSADELRIMLTEGPQRAWLALRDQEVLGFVVAFPTNVRGGPSWEIDLLAVHPAWRRHGLATKLVQTAKRHGSRVARRARAVVATDNHASARAFTRAGFRASAERHSLLINRLQPAAGQPGPSPTGKNRPARLSLNRDSQVAVQELSRPAVSNALLLQTVRDGQPTGLAELIEVQTVLYRGIWIESLQAASTIEREALVHRTLEHAADHGLDEVGAMVPQSDKPLQAALVAAGFFSLGEYRWFTASLSPPGASPASPGPERSEPHRASGSFLPESAQSDDV